MKIKIFSTLAIFSTFFSVIAQQPSPSTDIYHQKAQQNFDRAKKFAYTTAGLWVGKQSSIAANALLTMQEARNAFGWACRLRNFSIASYACCYCSLPMSKLGMVGYGLYGLYNQRRAQLSTQAP